MSATLIHYGHVRLIEKACAYGDVIIGLTRDEEVLERKDYQPEIDFKQRREILLEIKGVCEVVPTPWLITDAVLDEYNIDLLVHGDDNSNLVKEDRLIILPRTEGVSSTEIRQRAFKCLNATSHKKLLLTPGPAAIPNEALLNIKPYFGRGDNAYQAIEAEVKDWLLQLSGQDEVVIAQGSATFAIELAARSFLNGRVLLIQSGYYSQRILNFIPHHCDVNIKTLDQLEDSSESFDWVVSSYTETNIAYKNDLQAIRSLADRSGAKLFVDATASIGLEDHHELADVTAFSSCMGLFGLSGASFVTFKTGLQYRSLDSFYLNLDTHINKMVTSPCHVIASLHGILPVYDQLKQRVANSKAYAMERWANRIRGSENQPLLCTYLEGQVKALDDDVVLYLPRGDLTGSVICHIGELHHDQVTLGKRIEVN